MHPFWNPSLPTHQTSHTPWSHSLTCAGRGRALSLPYSDVSPGCDWGLGKEKRLCEGYRSALGADISLFVAWLEPGGPANLDDKGLCRAPSRGRFLTPSRPAPPQPARGWTPQRRQTLAGGTFHFRIQGRNQEAATAKRPG